MRHVNPTPAPPVSFWGPLGCAISVAIFLLFAAILAAFLALRPHHGPARTKPILWRSWVRQQPPLLGHFRSPAVEDYAGVFCHYFTDNTRSCWLTAIDGATFDGLWRIGPFPDADAEGIRALLVGDRVVVAYGTGRLAVYRAATGEELHSIDTHVGVSDACAAPPPVKQAWFQTGDDEGLLVDADTGNAAGLGRPAWCPKLPPNIAFRPQARLLPPEEAAASLAAEKDFVLDRVLEREGRYVAIGYRFDVWRNKTATAIRFDPKEKVVLWRQSVGPFVWKDEKLGAADIAGDLLVLFYPVSVSASGNAMFALVDLREGRIHCTRSVGGPVSLISPTTALSRDRVAFYLGPLSGNTDMLFRSTETCEDLPRPSPKPSAQP